MTTPRILLTSDQDSGARQHDDTEREQSRSPGGYDSSSSDFIATEGRPPWREGNQDDPEPATEKPIEELGERSALGEEISRKLKDFIMNHRKGLRNFYGGTELDLKRTLEVPIKKGEEMVKKLTSQNELACDLETAKDLTVLTLYNVAILIDDSDSMRNEEYGKRRKTLIQFVDHITEICSMANESGILALRFMNQRGGKKNWTGKSQDYLDHHSYGGVTRIGTELKKKILDIFAIGNPQQSKPLLVLIVTDGAVEGERKGHLKNVIRDCMSEREEAGKGTGAVAFQFTRIGNDPGAARLLAELDQDPDLEEYIDVLPTEFDLERRMSEKWFVLSRILLGAILPTWDTQDYRHADEALAEEDWEE